MKDTSGFDIGVGDVIFFEFVFQGRAIPRKGRVTKINEEKQKIKVLSNKDGGYCRGSESGVLCRTSMCPEPEPGQIQTRGYHSVHNWREFWITEDACPIIIGGPEKRMCEC